MVRVTLRLVLGCGLVAAGVAAAAPATAAAEGTSGAQTMIQLSVVPQDGGPGRTATLTCDPAGGTHPTPEIACAELADANGNVSQVPPRPGWFCLQVWDPVDATASGYWRGMPIWPYSETITNDGCARIAHGHVLDF